MADMIFYGGNIGLRKNPPPFVLRPQEYSTARSLGAYLVFAFGKYPLLTF